MSPDPATAELGDYLGIVRRRYLVVGIAVVACLVVGVGYTVTRPDVYRSTAEIALPRVADDQPGAAVQAEVQTELAVIRSDVVARRAAEALAFDGDARDLTSHLSVEAPPDARVLVISFDADAPEEARAGAGAFADAYLAQKEAEQRARIEARVETYEEQVLALEDGIATQEDILAATDTDSPEHTRAEDARDRLANSLIELEREMTLARAEPVDGGTIITPARPPRGPEADGLGRVVAASLAAGLLIGLAAAFVLDRLDTRVRGAADLRQTLGLSTLGSIPRFPDRHRHPGTALVTVHAPNGPEADAFRRLRTSVLLALRDDGARTLAITSAVAAEGKTTVAANLAVALAQGGRRVLLVAADLRRSGIEELFDLPAAPGLTDVLLGDETLDRVEHAVGDLVVITRGTPVDNPTDLLGSESTAEAVEALAHGFDLVIFDTPPVLAVADVGVLAPRVDATLLVVSLSQAGTAQVEEASTELTLAGARVLGATLNDDTDTTRRASSAAAYGLGHR